MIKPLPFFFRELSTVNQYLITNQAGTYGFLNHIDELSNIINEGVDSLGDEKKEELISKGFVAERDDQTLMLESIASKYATRLNNAVRKPGLFIIVPTLRCDHDCKYCQVSRVPLNKSGYDLNESDIDRILDIIQIVSGNEVKIEFQGGEPLLRFDLIKTLTEKAEVRFKTKQLSVVICTGTGPLNKSIIDWAKQHNVYFSISLDGESQAHNINRPSRYFDAYEQTVKAIEQIKANLGNDRVSCLSTITRNNLRQGAEIVNSYYALGMEGIFLRPLSPYGFARLGIHSMGYSADDYMSFFKTCMSQIIKLNEKRIFIEETILFHLKKIFRQHESGYVDLQSPSGYILGALVFNYNGMIFGSDEARMLWEGTRLDQLVLGNTHDPIETIINNKNNVTLLSNTFIDCCPGCDECAYQAYCGADPLYHLATQGDIVGNKTQSFHCKLERLMLDYLFEELYRDQKSSQVFKSWLNH